MPACGGRRRYGVDWRRPQLPGQSGVVHAALWRAGGVAATLDDGALRLEPAEKY